VRYYGVGIGGERGQMGAQRASGGRVCEQFFFGYAQIKKKIPSIWLQQKADAARPERVSASGTLNFSWVAWHTGSCFSAVYDASTRLGHSNECSLYDS
jgi:hypothetical protein